MHLVVMGLNHKTSPLWLRERLSFCAETVRKVRQHLRAMPHIHEAMILTTCNRVEFYCSCDSVEQGLRSLEQFIREMDVDLSQHGHCFYRRTETEAVTHLFRVISGVDSMVMGETQIINQVKEAFLGAKEQGTVGEFMEHLVHAGLEVGKRVRRETGISEGPLNIGSVAVDLAREFFGTLKNRSALIIGAGEMSMLTAKSLAGNGISTIIVANRTLDKAREIAHRLGGQAVDYEDFQRQMEAVDIVISSTAAPHPILKKTMLEKIMARRQGRLLFIIDLAMPRDVEPEVGQIPGVKLLNIDDLQQTAETATRARARFLAEVSRIIDEEVGRFAPASKPEAKRAQLSLLH